METVQTALWVVVVLVLMAVVFDFMNGFHDAANSIATVVSTGVLKPGQAVVFAAFFNVAAIFVFHLSVAATVGKGIVLPGVVDTHVVFGALVGAIVWNFITWYYGIPSSSPHALIGGIVGAAIAKAGVDSLISVGILKTVVFIFVSPLLGFLLGSAMMILVSWSFLSFRPLKVDKWFRRWQLVSAGAYSLGDGGNDAQKTIGIIWMLLIATGYTNAADNTPPTWVILICYSAIGLGTMFGGGRIVKTMGQKNHKTKTRRRFLCRDWRGHHLVFGHRPGRARFNHAHHHGCHCGRGRNPAGQCGALGSCRQHYLGLDSDHSGQCLCRGSGLLDQLAGFLMRLPPLYSGAALSPWPSALSISTTSSQRSNFQPHDLSKPTWPKPAL